jgi:hypothetical protein
MLNRCAVVVRKKQPFLDWLFQLPDPVDADTQLEQVNNGPHVYLLPDYAYLSEEDELIAEFYDLIFESELAGWWTHALDWPKYRTLNMFKEWFDVAFHSCIEDLVDAPLIDD